MHFSDVLNLRLRVARTARDGYIPYPGLGSGIDLKKDGDLLPGRILVLFRAQRRPVIPAFLHEQLNVGQGTLNLIGSEQISQLKLRGVRDLSGGGPIGDTFHGNASHKVIRNGKERQHDLAVRISFGLNTDVGKAPRAMQLVNAFADKFTVKRLPWLLGNEPHPSLLVDVGRYVGPADVCNNESLILSKVVVDGQG